VIFLSPPISAQPGAKMSFDWQSLLQVARIDLEIIQLQRQLCEASTYGKAPPATVAPIADKCQDYLASCRPGLFGFRISMSRSKGSRVGLDQEGVFRCTCNGFWK
jgi:hypothetical protein